MECKIIIFLSIFFEIEVIFFEKTEKKYGLPPGSACLWSKARPWEPLLDVAASLVLWLPPSPISGLNS